MEKEYIVCAKYCGAVVELGEFETEKQAEEFMKIPFVMFYADELHGIDEDEVIYPYEMWVEKAQHFDEVETYVFDYVSAGEETDSDIPF